MKSIQVIKAIGISIVLAAALTLFGGCKTQSNFIVMASATTLGFDVSYNGAQPQATLAFKRAEVAFVPVSTNYTPDALMEFRFNSSFTSQEIYSRIATGPHATVNMPAALMMAKDRNGNNTFTNTIFSFPPVIQPK